MEQSFSNMFRKSAFASLHPSQVLVARPRNDPWSAAGMAAKANLASMTNVTDMANPASEGVATTMATASNLDSVRKGGSALAGESADSRPLDASSLEQVPMQNPVVSQPTPTQRSHVMRAPSGQWGLKYTLRTDLSVIQLSTFDDEVLIRPRYWSGLHRSNAISSWKENFPAPKSFDSIRRRAMCDLDHDMTGLPNKPLQDMTQAEWSQWLSFARSKRADFQLGVKEKRLSEENWKNYIGLDRLHTRTEGIHPVHYSTCEDSLPSNNATRSGRYMSSSQSSTQSYKKVCGRLLNSVNWIDYAVGVSGVVAYLHRSNVDSHLQRHPGRSSLNRRMPIDRSVTHNFWVMSASHDHLGRPNVILTMQDRNSTSLSAKDGPISHLRADYPSKEIYATIQSRGIDQTAQLKQTLNQNFNRGLGNRSA
ncbi:hypothetical protein BSLG_009978 [Batrachochytrium salamandrivorans]|nr:hypothetical protein BASA60_008421 [Batrachochytrium salamandrivorans]KAJ1328743.1 hypothetical protein BSLG_009978 [Batrachochytrium salamandrivorans]